MEQYGLIRELELLATARDWKFLVGPPNYANIEIDYKIDVGQYILWVQINPATLRAKGNRLNRINYTGEIILLSKFDSTYTPATNQSTKANLDETFKQKYDRRLKDLNQLLSDELGSLACSNQLQILSDNYEYVTNVFDTNCDGVVARFNIEQENFTAIADLFNLTLTAGANGSVEPFEGTEGQQRYTYKAINADPDPGYRFDKWTLDNGQTITDALTTIYMNKDRTALAEFIVSLIKQLTISVSGTGTTSPIPGNYDIESGGSQLIEAIETDVNYIFEKFDQDGTESVANPGNFTVIENSLVVAYFIIKWLQWVFGTAPQKIVDKYYFIDRSPNASNVQIKNTQVGNFNGTVYIAYDMTGRTIASYESDGAAIPTRTSDVRIDISAGLLYSITLDNGQKCTLNEGSEDVIFFTDGTTTTSGTLESVVLATFWNTKSEYGTPGNTINGYNKYLVNQIAGSTIHLAAPDLSNLGADQLSEDNARFTGGVGDWIGERSGTITATGGVATITPLTLTFSGAKLGSAFTGINIGDYYRIRFDYRLKSGVAQALALRSTFSAGAAADQFFPNSTWQSYNRTAIATSGNMLIVVDSNIVANGASYEFDNFCVEKVNAISLLSTFKFKLKPTICDTYFIDSNTTTVANGYMARTTPTAITLYRVDAGALTQLNTAAITYVDYQDIEPVFSISGIVAIVNGIEILSSADTTYPTFKFVLVDNDVTDEFSHFEKDTIKYDLSNFENGIGVYGIQKTPGNTTLLDCKGNTLLIPANVVSNEGNTHRGIKYGALEATDATYEEVYVIVDDASTTITKTTEETAGYVSELKIL